MPKMLGAVVTHLYVSARSDFCHDCHDYLAQLLLSPLNPPVQPANAPFRVIWAARSFMVTKVQPPDRHHVTAAQGWLGLGNYAGACAELDQITPTTHPSRHARGPRGHLPCRRSLKSISAFSPVGSPKFRTQRNCTGPGCSAGKAWRKCGHQSLKNCFFDPARFMSSGLQSQLE